MARIGPLPCVDLFDDLTAFLDPLDKIARRNQESVKINSRTHVLNVLVMSELLNRLYIPSEKIDWGQSLQQHHRREMKRLAYLSHHELSAP